jgi:hypothetical protein
MIKAATPKAIPAVAMAEIKLINFVDRPERV